MIKKILPTILNHINLILKINLNKNEEISAGYYYY